MKRKKEPYQNRIELLQGALDMLTLQALEWGPMHGYGLAQATRLKSGELLRVETGSLYRALHRLARQKWVTARWELTDSKQRAKFYRITARGKEQLASDHERGQQMAQAIGSIMEPGEG